MNTLISINETNLNESNLITKANDVISKINEGELDALQVHLIAKAYNKMCDMIIKETMSKALDEADKYNNLDRKLLGASFELKNGADTYDFEADYEYSRLKQNLKHREELLKDAIKAAKKGCAVVDELGEIVAPVPMKKSGSYQLAVSFK